MDDSDELPFREAAFLRPREARIFMGRVSPAKFKKWHAAGILDEPTVDDGVVLYDPDDLRNAKKRLKQMQRRGQTGSNPVADWSDI